MVRFPRLAHDIEVQTRSNSGDVLTILLAAGTQYDRLDSERITVKSGPWRNITFVVPSNEPVVASDPSACPRCEGLGGKHEWPGFTCFACGGTGRA